MSDPMAGWDYTKWNDPNKHDPKYDVGHVLSQYPHTPAGLQAAMAAIKKLYPTANLQGLDHLMGIPGTGSHGVDVLMGAHEGGTGWWWGDQGDGTTTPPTTATAPTPTQAASPFTAIPQPTSQAAAPASTPPIQAGDIVNNALRRVLLTNG